MTGKIIAVIGGGSFGTAIADIIASNGHEVRQWMRDEALAKDINKQRVNSRYLPDYQLHEGIHASTDIFWVVAEADVIFVSIPSSSFRSVVQTMKEAVVGKVLISTTKGVEAGSFDLMSQILAEEVPEARIGVLSGPNLAKEVVAKAITATVIASDDEALCQEVQGLLHSDYFRVYSNHDIYGVELGGALKNIYAIVAGLAESLGMGENTKSMLITRSLAEMSRFAVKMGANPLTFLGLSGVGDLIVTCTSSLSRNFRVGYALGQGKSLEEAEAELGQVAEGINTLQLVRAKARELEVYMPLVDGLYEIVVNKRSIRDVTRHLMLGEQKTDVEFILQSD
ncbi:NAD(P)H-dependent glycerol-3-phosphate dehydrogenase [Aestuariirhabdus sp. Z084]|uniref:NAD(P)H-dependent glycerol-3-phosphate dehydrogenase n=1 Tax=Aestuariirhabdus haliotis TaxID=2918751 RepID=UPI00201B37EA|nr:NAD(P)H-dependent glycerol-3-phosphate dehydrogenase [Aestuariirhabdus haliotis]MCL6414520.1 NAD(P)H-dependent glycerol-3-phosphate dehydrogenase [Aestuariirhabdus haliotis]MCL6418498.1 NAD(P)H-dependent glycerol-3-phosphate dehydrogenase [Aestuariirhabdus haliotis]